MFHEVTNQPFVLMRHDVEFSVNRAHAMAIIEKKLGIRSNYFFQISI